MDPTTAVAVLSSCGGVLAAALTYLGVRLTQRQAVKAQAVAAEIEQVKVNAAAYAEARHVWDALIADLRTKVADQKHEISDLRRGLAAQRADAELLRKRLEDMEQKRAGDRYAIHVLAVYARQLLKVIKDANLVPPPPPEGLDLEG
uniref:hypothetical protein n=1 Tax=Pseudonocardia sp. CA-138482 TaxID=3240023 RepID=UPI003F491EB7